MAMLEQYSRRRTLWSCPLSVSQDSLVLREAREALARCADVTHVYETLLKARPQINDCFHLYSPRYSVTAWADYHKYVARQLGLDAMDERLIFAVQEKYATSTWAELGVRLLNEIMTVVDKSVKTTIEYAKFYSTSASVVVYRELSLINVCKWGKGAHSRTVSARDDVLGSVFFECELQICEEQGGETIDLQLRHLSLHAYDEQLGSVFPALIDFHPLEHSGELHPDAHMLYEVYQGLFESKLQLQAYRPLQDEMLQLYWESYRGLLQRVVDVSLNVVLDAVCLTNAEKTDLLQKKLDLIHQHQDQIDDLIDRNLALRSRYVKWMYGKGGNLKSAVFGVSSLALGCERMTQPIKWLGDLDKHMTLFNRLKALA